MVNPKRARDETVSGGGEHFAAEPRLFTVGDIDARLSVQTVGLAVMGWCARPVPNDLKPVAIFIYFVSPGRVEESGTMRLVHDCHDMTTAVNDLVPRDLLKVEAFRRP